jgi:predicted kinase
MNVGVGLLVVVTGHPATGKTTVARALAAELALPAFHKDVIKEQLAEAVGFSDRASSQRLGHAATLVLYDIAERLLGAGQSVLLESNFPAEFSSAPLRSSAERHGARVVQVVLRAPQEVMEHRFAQRDRHPVHVQRELGPMPPYVALDLPGVLIELDTTSLPVDLGPVLAAARLR